MNHIVNTSWEGNMKFDANIGGHHLIMDVSAEAGGENSGPSPKKLMLASLAGCTGMDVVAILKKMKVEFDHFDIKIEATVTEEHPKQYNKMHILFQFKGKNLDREKLQKAVDLSQDKYCGVSAVYKKALEVSYEVVISE